MTQSLPRSTPGAEGVSADGIQRFVGSLESYGGVDSVMVLRHGSVITEQWWAPAAADLPHALWSLSKSFTSIAVGLVIDSGLLAVDSRVAVLLPDELPATVDERLARLTVKNLLTMTTGHAAESLPESDRAVDANWAKHILAQPLAFDPGTHFQYNSGATYLLSAIVQRLTGETVLDYLTPRLFDPLGIENPTWTVSPQGISTGGWGLRARTEDVAKFGELILRKGRWGDAHLIPAHWVDEATRRQVSNGDPADASDWTQGYGYQFWTCRHGAIRGDGKNGQFCVILPELDAVVVLTGDLIDMQGELNLVWEHLLPAIGGSVTT